ncbi:DUF1648 domain-containing protein [Micrococcus porci]|uniref:DUF1648 domain-containing protein n=1 Tax=Micrococcus porci TaxID=2856555 RepID=UPI003CF87471
MSHPVPAPDHDDIPAAERDALRRGRALAWWPLVLAVLLNAGMLAWAVAALPGLPEHVPVHWGVGGRPDRWARTSFGACGTPRIPPRSRPSARATARA